MLMVRIDSKYLKMPIMEQLSKEKVGRSIIPIVHPSYKGEDLSVVIELLGDLSAEIWSIEVVNTSEYAEHNYTPLAKAALGKRMEIFSGTRN